MVKQKCSRGRRGLADSKAPAKKVQEAKDANAGKGVEVEAETKAMGAAKAKPKEEAKAAAGAEGTVKKPACEAG